MQKPEEQEEAKYCPGCGARTCSRTDSVFVEYGDWNDDSYDEEGDVEVYRCSDTLCSFEFADVRGIPHREKPEWTSLQNLTCDPTPETTEQGI